MKFLKESTYKVSDETLKISATCKSYSSSQQSHMLTLMTSSEFKDRVELGHYALKNCIKTLAVDGDVIDANKLADSADLTDKATLDIYLAIGELCAIANSIDEIELKK